MWFHLITLTPYIAIASSLLLVVTVAAVCLGQPVGTAQTPSELAFISSHTARARPVARAARRSSFIVSEKVPARPDYELQRDADVHGVITRRAGLQRSLDMLPR